ncbi:MAG: TIGR02281 family clan AA aspartic protease [Rhodobacteraceae bacterium]|nr:TIGR02281 family clan AA aspartic protease [Paracoccaceae bacterium]
MSGDDLGQLIYLILLASVIGAYFIVENRARLGRVAQQAVVWGLIFLGVVAGYGLWDRVARETTGRGLVAQDGTLELTMAPDGHFYVTATVDGTRVNFVIDTGASDIVLSRRDAERLGIDTAALAYTGRALTANGRVETAPVTLGMVELAGFRDAGVPAVVNSGELDTSLLGMSYLSRYRITIDGRRMTLAR